MKVKATQLIAGDEFSDGTYVVHAYNDDFDGVWLETNGAYEDAGYVDSDATFDVTRP